VAGVARVVLHVTQVRVELLLDVGKSLRQDVHMELLHLLITSQLGIRGMIDAAGDFN